MGLPRCSSVSAAATWTAAGATRYAGEGGIEMDAPRVLDSVRGYRVRHVCLAGGALLQKESRELISLLLDAGKVVHQGDQLGSLSLEGLPASPRPPDKHGLQVPILRSGGQDEDGEPGPAGPKDQLKFVVADKEDLETARDVVVKGAPRCPVILLRWEA